MEVRRIRSDEADRLRGLRLATLADAPDAFVTTSAQLAEKTMEYWEKAARLGATSASRAAFVAESDGVWHGGISVVVREDGAEVQAMWVRPEQRQSGVAETLVEHALAWCAEQGISRAFARINEHNVRALALAERCGFTRTDTLRPLGTFNAVLLQRHVEPTEASGP